MARADHGSALGGQPQRPGGGFHRWPGRDRLWMSWANLRLAWWLVVGATLARIVFLVALNPMELVKDEAHYWEWSRYLSLSYYTKGPGVGWLIAASVRVLGDHEWSVRLPAALASAATAMVLAYLARDVSRGDQRVGFLAAAMFLLVPAYQVIALLMTIDGPYVACWVLSVWAMWHLGRRWQKGQAGWGPAAGIGLALGAGFLFKYTILLLVPGLVAWVWTLRRQLRMTSGAWCALALGAVLLLISASPVLIWNQQHGWPTVVHLLGRLHLVGGDEPVGEPWSPLYLLEFVGSQIGILGPAAVALMVMAVVAAWRGMGSRAYPAQGQTLMLWSALPILLFYLVIAVFKKSQANWAIAGYVTLLVLMAQGVVRSLPRYVWLVERWLARPAPRPRRGWLRAKPETSVQIAWHMFVAWGCGAAVLVLLLPALAHLPVLTPLIPRHRFEGQRRLAAIVQQHIDQTTTRTGQPPLLVSDHYGDTSLLAFYLPGRPRVYSAQRYLGRRPCAYDFFPQTDLHDPALLGRDVLMIHSYPEHWQHALRLKRFTVLDAERQVYLGEGYGGVNESAAEGHGPDG